MLVISTLLIAVSGLFFFFGEECGLVGLLIGVLFLGLGFWSRPNKQLKTIHYSDEHR